MIDSNAIHIKNLVFTWNKSKIPILSIPEWQVQRGEQIFLFGSSGAGKSTLLNLLAGIVLPKAGTVDVLGQSLSALGPSARDKFRAKHIGVIFQQFNLLPYLSVLDNIRLGSYFAVDKPFDKAYMEQILDSLELSSDPVLLHSKARELSVGQQQRVAVARALINKPDIIVADEPTSALDSDLRDQFINLLFATTGEINSTVVFVSHDRSLAGHFSKQVNLDELNQISGKVTC